MTTKKLGVLVFAAAAFAMACTDTSGPSRSLLPTSSPSLDLSAVDLGDPHPPGMAEGEIRLCKETGAGDAALPWSFTVTAVAQIGAAPVAPTSPVVIQGISGDTACATVFISTKNGAELDKVTITEQALPANWALTHIHVRLYDDGPYPGPPAPGNTIGGSLASRSVEVYINEDMQRVVTFTNDFTAPPTGTEGCTPGYWKQDQHFDSWVGTGFAPGDDFDTVFGDDWFNPNITLLQALNLTGGGKNALARHAVAALLNAASGGVNYPMTTADVLAAVHAAFLAQSTIESTKNTLAGNNELGCPIN
jgi:hypothetical protein